MLSVSGLKEEEEEEEEEDVCRSSPIYIREVLLAETSTPKT
jgi:chorismate-pyruvate lyase